MIHEHLITFDIEVKYFWSTKISGAVIIFFANRYLNLLANSAFVIVQALLSPGAKVRRSPNQCITVAHCFIVGVSIIQHDTGIYSYQMLISQSSQFDARAEHRCFVDVFDMGGWVLSCDNLAL